MDKTKGSEKKSNLLLFFVRHIGLVIAILMALFSISILIYTKSFEVYNNNFSDKRLAIQDHKASDKYVIITLSQNDLISLNRVNFERSLLVDAVKKIKNLGAKKLFIDFLLIEKSSPKVDEDLLSVMKDFGKNNIAFGRDQNLKTNPPDYFSQNATRLDNSLYVGKDIFFRNIVVPKTKNSANPAIWLSTGAIDSRDNVIDLRINPSTLQVINFTSLMSLNDENALNNKVVIFAIDKNLSLNRVILAAHGTIGRGELIALASQSFDNNYDKNVLLANNYYIFLAILFGLFGFASGLIIRSPITGFFIVIIAIISNLFIANYMISKLGAKVEPYDTIFAFLIAFSAALSYRLKIHEVFSSFLAGNMSPEEVWLWHTKISENVPVILFDNNRNIKKLNQIAKQTFFLDKKNLNSNEFGRNCIPNFDEKIKVLKIDGGKETWRVHWPHDSILMAVFYNISEHEKARIELENRIIIDPLTGVLNRLGFEQALDEIDNKRIDNFAIYYLDMNGFKSVNDNYGHDAGDELLKIVAKKFSNILREGDKIARLGGDEFGIITYGEINADRAQIITQKLKSTLDKEISLEKANVKVGVSAGYAISNTKHISTKSVLKKADEMMYRDKNQSRLTNSR